MIRKAPRIKTRIIASVQGTKTGAGQNISALISDISANGLSLESKQLLGEKGAILNLAFRIQLHNVDAFLSIKGVIRAVIHIDDTPDALKAGVIRHGIELQDLQPNDTIVLQSMIYQQMIENPHTVM